MRTKKWARMFFALAIAVPAILAGLSVTHPASVATAQNKDTPDLENAKFYGADNCMKCHRTPGENSDEFVKLTEYETWKTEDKHSLAFLVLEGPRGQQIGNVLNIDVTRDAQCLNCHAVNVPKERRGQDFLQREGVSCDACHGPAQHWAGPHFNESESWRQKTPEQKEALGMFDVRNPVKKAAMCMSCHVGSAAEGKVVTHAMYAAGHPPLPSIEVALFTKNLPVHWHNIKDVRFFKEKASVKTKKQNYWEDAEFQDSKLVIASHVIALRSMSRLIADRARFNDKPGRDAKDVWPPPWFKPYATREPRNRWPELPKEMTDPSTELMEQLWPEIVMAQGDCYACHHELKSQSWRQVRTSVGKPGRPQLLPWPFVLAPVTLAGTENETQYAQKVQKIASAFDSRPFGVPKDVAEATAHLDEFLRPVLNPHFIMTRAMAEKALGLMLAKGRSSYLDYESARQLASSVKIILSELENTDADRKAIEEIFNQLDDSLNLTVASSARKTHVEERRNLVKMTVSEMRKKGKKQGDIFDGAVEEKQKFLSDLKKISDRELAESLSRVNNYNPKDFKDVMSRISAAWRPARSKE